MLSYHMVSSERHGFYHTSTVNILVKFFQDRSIEGSIDGLFVIAFGLSCPTGIGIL